MGVERPKVSILVPVYNVEKYLRQCLDSVINQTLREIEIICINDGSTDSSYDILKEYADMDSRIKIIAKENTGYGNSMNVGLDAATGDYIGIVESDDFIEKNMFESLYNLAEKDNLDVARSEFFFYEHSTGVDTKSDFGYVPHNVVIEPSNESSVFYQQPSIWANIYNFDFLKRNAIRFLETPGASYQDTSFSFKVYLRAKRFEMIDEPFYHYRINAGSSSFQSTTKVFCVVDEYDEIKRYLKENDLYNKYSCLVAHMEYNGYLWNYKRLAEPYRSEFVKKWQQIASEEFDKGCITSDVFSGEEMARVRSIIDCGTINIDPVVSVIVPIYNTEQYLEKCLNSIACQTFYEIEIICVNDGTKDNSQCIVDRFMSKDDRFISIVKKNGGLSSARNVGLKKARGKYVAFVDSDDWIEPFMLERAVKNMDCVDAVIMGVNIVGDVMLDRRKDDSHYYSVNYSGVIDVTDDVLLNTHVSAWNKLYRLDIIRNHNIDFPEGLLYEDYAFFWKYFVYCKKIFFDTVNCYNYLRRQGSIMYMTLSEGNKRAIEHLIVFDRVMSYYEKTNISLVKSTLNSMFLNCFWFAYLNVPSSRKKMVMHKGSDIVIRYAMTGQKDIDAFRIKDYELVDPRGAYQCKVRVLKWMLRKLLPSVGVDISSIIDLMYNKQLPVDESSNSLATTDWVNRHEMAFKLFKWITVYDQYSECTDINFNYLNGLTGTVFIKQIDSWLISGTKVRFYVILWGAESCILESKVVYEGRFVNGTSVYDGTNLYAISVDCCKESKTITIRAVNPITGEDFSKYCRIYCIEISK